MLCFSVACFSQVPVSSHSDFTQQCCCAFSQQLLTCKQHSGAWLVIMPGRLTYNVFANRKGQGWLLETSVTSIVFRSSPEDIILLWHAVGNQILTISGLDAVTCDWISPYWIVTNHYFWSFSNVFTNLWGIESCCCLVTQPFLTLLWPTEYRK